MANDSKPNPQSGQDRQKGENAGIVTRRRALMMGAVTASAVVSIKPALAQTAGSVLNCEIPIPGNHAAGGYIAPDGKVVPPDTPGAFPPAYDSFSGEEIRRAMSGRSLPGVSREQSKAYVNYVRRLQSGQSGFTCYASLQMPR
ncbi:hypothetical protein SAMN02745824_2223 [Parasphingorhabdus marina DSM 22363]|uniref:Uncharacterized protein n=1 Tax=Parasphingorhabdus marina DSM 22363 TaxID=1123272 RepID=A0A1N6F3Z7_9SPHN|nr:hypothetical protein SAMN02745824_2223 [Parasphingorhabdus marina DSM 22363]